jgi:hypothetical protein
MSWRAGASVSKPFQPVEKAQVTSSFYRSHAKFERRRQSESEIYSSIENFFNRMVRFL